MHSTTITAFLLPLLLSSVLAVPTPVQNEAATQSAPPPAQFSLENGLLKSRHPLEAAWVKAGSPGRKRSLKSRQFDGAAQEVAEGNTSPANLDPEAGMSPADIDFEHSVDNTDYEMATGQIHDPQDCSSGSCKRSLEGRQVGDDDDSDDGSPAAADSTAGLTPEDIDIDQGIEIEDHAQATGQDPSLCHGSCGRSLKGRQDDSEAATTPATNST